MKKVIILLFLELLCIAIFILAREYMRFQKQAPDLMPKQFLQKQVMDMSIGDVGFVGTYDIIINKHQECFLNGDAIVHREKIMDCVLIERKKDGFHIYIKDVNDRWRKSSYLFRALFFDWAYIPVIKIHY